MIRALTDLEQRNFDLVKIHTNNLAIIILTQTGFEKSIMDATYGIRLFLRENKIHDFSEQLQGPDYKVVIKSYLFAEDNFHDISTSLYRPKTKDGDPRIWFLGLKEHFHKECALMLIALNKEIYVLNLSEADFANLLINSEKFRNFLTGSLQKEEAIAKELFDKILNLYDQGWIKTIGRGDKAVGETLENALGISTNSSKKPDYKGIELKSYRKGRKGKVETRSNLFAQVAQWSFSKFKSSHAMLERFGYERNGKRRLNCTVNALNSNSLGLKFKIDLRNEFLIEVHDEEGECLLWSFDLLIARLKEKHNETFWVEADVRLDANGKEEFLYQKIIHTKAPILTELIPLMTRGIVTMDHLISKREGETTLEKGPLFKIDKKNLSLLFPDPNSIEFILLDRDKK